MKSIRPLPEKIALPGLCEEGQLPWASADPLRDVDYSNLFLKESGLVSAVTVGDTSRSGNRYRLGPGSRRVRLGIVIERR